MKFFKLTKIRRLIILGATLIASILSIVLGSHYYVKDNARLSIEYGGGAEYLVKIKTDSKTQSAASIATDVAQEIYDRINPTGNNGANAEPEISGNDASVRVIYPDTAGEDEKKRIEDLIISKPHFTFTDVFGNPLFDENGIFRRTELQGAKGLVMSSKPYLMPASDPTHKYSQVPLKSGAARNVYQNGEHKVEINLIPSKSIEWTKATQYISSLKNGQNQIVAWLDIDKFIQNLALNYPQFLVNAHGNPVLAARVDGKASSALLKNTIDASQYLISQAKVEKVLSGNSFVVQGSFTQKSASELARKINYGASNYSLEKIYSNYIKASYGTNAFHKAIIAGLIVFIFIAIFLVANYGLLGALSTISIALYVFITLALFTVMRGEYSPETIAALIIGIGMAVDANIITFERLKSEVYFGSSIKKASKDSNKKSLSTIFDANITTLIVAFVLFFFGTRNIIGLSVTLILSILLTLIVMLGFTRMMATTLVNTGMFETRRKWLGIQPKFDNSVQAKINKIDFIKSSKWFALGSSLVLGAGMIVMSITAGIAGTFSGGFNLSQEFKGGTVVQISNPLKVGSDTRDLPLSDSEKDEITKALIDAGAASSDIENIYNSNNELTSIKLSTDSDINVGQFQTAITKSHPHFKVYSSNTTTDVAQKILHDAMLAVLIAILAIVIYTLIRFRWTYSFAAIVALVHDGLIVTAVFVITRVEISPVFIAGLLSIIGYSINDTIVTFDRVRENMQAHIGEHTKETIKEIANRSIRETLKRSLLTSFTTIMAVVILMSFGNATKITFNIAMLVGLVAGTYSSIFIATYLWTKLEWKRQAWIKNRENKSFWKTEGVEEQTFEGINDFSA